MHAWWTERKVQQRQLLLETIRGDLLFSKCCSVVTSSGIEASRTTGRVFNTGRVQYTRVGWGTFDPVSPAAPSAARKEHLSTHPFACSPPLRRQETHRNTETRSSCATAKVSLSPAADSQNMIVVKDLYKTQYIYS